MNRGTPSSESFAASFFGTTSQGSKSGKSLPASRIAGRRSLPKRTNSGISPFRRTGRSAYAASSTTAATPVPGAARKAVAPSHRPAVEHDLIQPRSLADVTRRAHRARRGPPCIRGCGAYRPIRPVPADPAGAHCTRRRGRREGFVAGARRTCIRPSRGRAPPPGTNPQQAPTRRSDGPHPCSGARPPCSSRPNRRRRRLRGSYASGRSSTGPRAIPRRSTREAGRREGRACVLA